MKKRIILKSLDYFPLIILFISVILLLIKVTTGNAFLHWKHIVGLCLLPVNTFLFFRNHKTGVVALGITLSLGLSGLISYSPAITTATSYISIGDGSPFTIFYGQPVFLLWLVIHLAVSFRQYIGIGTKQYWQELFRGIKQVSVK